VDTEAFAIRHIRVWFGAPVRSSIGLLCGAPPGATRSTTMRRHAMQAIFARAYVAGGEISRRLFQAHGQQGQGTVEYVGLILLVALLMVGMVAAMKGFQGKQGLELAETIVDKIRSAVNQVTFK
jgi:hypothetical protein